MVNIIYLLAQFYEPDVGSGVDGSAQRVIQAPKPQPRIMRYELSDYEWTATKRMLPNKPRGVPRVNDRRVLNGIFWSCGQVRRGETCLRVLGRTPLATIASHDDGFCPHAVFGYCGEEKNLWHGG